VLDESSIYIAKRSIIYKATLSDSLYLLSPLKPFDGKSQTIGGVRNASTFSSGNSVYLISPDNQILELARVESIDYPQTAPISDAIKPTVDQLDFVSSSGITFKDKSYFSARSSNSAVYNDVVLVWNVKDKTWDSPIIGWSISQFAVYDDGTGENLYLSSDNSPNVYSLTNVISDVGQDIKASWRSKQFDFGSPHQMKEMTNMFVEGYMSQNTSLNISLLADEDGYTQRLSTTLLGTETAFIYDPGEYNSIGLSAFGTQRFGANNDYSNRKKFRVYLNRGLRVSPFYNAQLEFSSEGESQAWEITNIGFQIRPYSQPENRNLYREFK
jgi:hypothetical protein